MVKIKEFVQKKLALTEEQAKKNIRNQFLMNATYDYRRISDDELQRYIHFLESPAGAKFSKESIELFIVMLTEIIGKTRELLEFKVTESAAKISEEFNYRFRLPGSPWFEVNPAIVNKDASFALQSPHPLMQFIIISEKIGDDIPMTSSDLLKFSQQFLTELHDKVTLTEPELITINGLEGYQFISRAQSEKVSFNSIHWVMVKNGFAYQLFISTDSNDRKLLEKAATELFPNFELLDPELIIYSNGQKPMHRFQSDVFGYSFDLTEENWFAQFQYTLDYPDADIVVNTQEYSCVVQTILFDKSIPERDSIIQSFLSGHGIEYPSPDITLVPEETSGSWKRYLLEYSEKTADATYIYRIKVFIGEGISHCLTLFTLDTEKEIDTISRQIFSSFRNTPKAHTIALHSLPKSNLHIQAVFHNRIGLYYFNEERFEEASGYFEAAIALNSEEKVYLTNLLTAYARIEEYEKALSVLADFITQYEQDDDIIAWRAWLHSQQGDTAEALKLYTALFEGDYRNDEDFTEYVSLLSRVKRIPELNRAFDRYCTEESSIELRILQADLLTENGLYQESIDVLNGAQKDIPFNRDIAFAIAQNQQALRQFKSVLEIADKLLALNETAGAYYLKGEAEYELKWYQKAKQSFEKALILAPDNVDIEDYIRHISGLIGEGNNSVLKTEISPVLLPQSLQKKIDSLKGRKIDEKFEGYGASYLYSVDCISFNRGVTQKLTIYEKILVIDEVGVSKFSTLQFDFDPLSENIYINVLRVRDEHDAIVSEGNVDEYFIIDDSRDAVVSHDQIVNLPIANLKPHYSIEIVITLENKDSADFFSFDYMTLSKSRPVLFSGVSFTGDTSQIRFKTENIAPLVHTKDEFSVCMEMPQIYEWEPMQVPYDTYLPMIWMSDALYSWEKVGSEYLERIDDISICDDLCKTTASQLIDTETEKATIVAILINHLQREYTYKPLEFGVRSQTPKPPSKTISDRYGDCKDFAVLLQQLLTNSGIPAFLALTNTANKIIPELPGLGQFNHMIVYLPEEDKFIDPTINSLPMPRLVPAGLADRYALILDSENFVLRKIPPYQSEKVSIAIERVVAINEDDIIAVKETLFLNDYTASFFRDYLKSYEASDYVDQMQSLLSPYATTLIIEDVNVKSLFENEEPLEIRLSYRIEGSIQQNKSDTSFSLPHLWEEYYLWIRPLRQRLTDFQLNYPFSVKNRTTFSYPDGYSVSVDTTEKSGRSEFGSWIRSASASNDSVTVEFSCVQNTGEYKSAAYDEYRYFLDDALSALSELIHLSKLGD